MSNGGATCGQGSLVVRGCRYVGNVVRLSFGGAVHGIAFSTSDVVR